MLGKGAIAANTLTIDLGPMALNPGLQRLPWSSLLFERSRLDMLSRVVKSRFLSQYNRPYQAGKNH